MRSECARAHEAGAKRRNSQNTRTRAQQTTVKRERTGSAVARQSMSAGQEPERSRAEAEKRQRETGGQTGGRQVLADVNVRLRCAREVARPLKAAGNHPRQYAHEKQTRYSGRAGGGRGSSNGVSIG